MIGRMSCICKVREADIIKGTQTSILRFFPGSERIVKMIKSLVTKLIRYDIIRDEQQKHQINIERRRMAMKNMPVVKVGVVAVSRDCFPMSLSENRRKALVAAYQEKYGEIYECPICIENELHMRQALGDIREAGCNALVVYLGNFGPESSETLLAKEFGGPVMFVAAAEESGDNLVQGRGDAYCGMLNASYNLKLREITAYIPEYPVGTAVECADMIQEFLPVARTILGLRNLKIITFGPRPQDFLACNAPIKRLYDLGVEIEENSELDLFEAYHKHAGDERIAGVVKEMEAIRMTKEPF